MKNVLNYSKFIFLSGPAGGETQGRTPETPRQQVDHNLTTLQQKQQQELREKEEAAKRLKDNKEKLHEAWLKRKPGEAKDMPEENPAILALKNVPGMDGKEAFMLLSLVGKNSKLGGFARAREIYGSCWSGGKFDIEALRKFFTRDVGYGTLGFYYGSKKETKTTKRWYWSDKKETSKKTGWWTIDSDDKDDDEFSGEKCFLKAVNHVRGELNVPKGGKGYNDSSLSEGEEKAMVKDLGDLDGVARNASAEVFAKDVLDWVKKEAHGKWAVMDSETASKMGYVFGEGCGTYQYRFFKDKVFALRIPGAATPKDKKDAGFIEIKNGKLDTKWNNLDPNDLKKQLLDNMEPVDIQRELGVYKVESGEPLAAADELAVTKGLVSAINGLPEKATYNNLESGFLNVVKTKLAEKLRADPKLKDRAEALARTRVEDLKKKIQDAIRKNDALKRATNIDNDPNNKDANQNVSLTFKVDSNDEVKVDFEKPTTRSKFRALAAKAKDEAEGAGKYAREAMGKVEKKLKKIFGPLAGFIMKIFPKLGEGIKDLASGVKSKAATTAGILTGLLGITVVSHAVGADKMDQKAIDATITESTNEHTLKKTVLSSEVTLNGKKIVIPKGLGITPGGKFNVTAKKSNGEVKTEEVGGKPAKKRMFGFGGGGKEEVLKDDEITIEAGTKIPKDTVIPAGAKIIKV